MSVEPRNDGGATLSGRAAGLRPEPASPSQRSSIPSAFGFRVGDRVRHVSSAFSMGAGTVTSVADGDVVVQFDQRGRFGRISTGVYGDHWFRTANATLIHEAPETERSTPVPAPLSDQTVPSDPEAAETAASLLVVTDRSAVAQGIEARQGGNGEAGAVHESPTPLGDAPDTAPAALKATPPQGDET